MAETRTVTEVKLYLLILNPMRGNAETKQLVAAAYDKDKLIEWYNSQKVEQYEDEGTPSFQVHGDSHTWHKSFAHGSDLEWYNPCESLEVNNLDTFGHGIIYEWVPEEETPNLDIKIIDA